MSARPIPSRIVHPRPPVTVLVTAWLCLIAALAQGETTSRSTGNSSVISAAVGRSIVLHGDTHGSAGLVGGFARLSMTPDLPAALSQAADDPADNLIAFDRTSFGKSTLTIRLAAPLVISAGGAGHDTLDGSGLCGGLVLDASECREAAIIVESDARLTVRSVTVRGAQQRAIVIKDRGQVTFEQVAIEKSGGPGIALFGEAAATLTNCTVSASRTHGLELHGHSSLSLANCSILDGGQSGLAVFDDARAEGAGCRLDGNGEWGVVAADRGRLSLARTVIRGGRFANADLSDAAALTLTDCTARHGLRFGVFATGDATLTLTRTSLSENGGRGIELQDRSSLTATDSRIEANSDYGVVLFRNARAKAERTLFAANGAHGVSLCDGAVAEFDTCTFSGNRYSGVACPDARDGGRCLVTRSQFQRNGMRPIYRGPLHIDPMVPTPISIDGPRVTCMADPNARIELYLDRVGEAARFVRTLQADGTGRFEVDLRDVPEGWVMTATATAVVTRDRGASSDAGCSTSEFNVIAGSSSGPILAALTARTGPLSDDGGDMRLDARLRRWQRGTRLVLQFDGPPGRTAESYLRFLVPHVSDWTLGQITAETRVGLSEDLEASQVVVPIRYLPSEAEELQGRGGVTFMKWNMEGSFLQPMKILLASAPDPRDCCPRVLAHEIGHALGLGHVRVGLLSRMQGSVPPVGDGMVNDFSPTFTFYDVQALRLLHDPEDAPGTTLRKLAERGQLPITLDVSVAQASPPAADPSFSPPVPRLDPVVSPEGVFRGAGSEK